MIYCCKVYHEIIFQQIFDRSITWEDPTKWVILRYPWNKDHSRFLHTLRKLRQVDVVLNRNHLGSDNGEIILLSLFKGFEHFQLRNWSKSIGGGGPEQRGGESWGFEPCERGGSCSFQLPLRGGSPYFSLTTNETVDYTSYIKHSQLELLLKYSQTCCARQAAHLYGRGTLRQPLFFWL